MDKRLLNCRTKRKIVRYRYNKQALDLSPGYVTEDSSPMLVQYDYNKISFVDF